MRFCSGVASALCLVLGTAVVIEFLDSNSRSGVGGGIVASVLVIELARRAPFDALVVEGPAGILRARPCIIATPDAAQPVPWVLLATKAHQTAGAADWLRALATPQTTVAMLVTAPTSSGTGIHTLSPDRPLAEIPCRAKATRSTVHPAV
jgi:hypothetical protein